MENKIKKLRALMDFKHSGSLLIEEGKTYEVKKYCDRYFYPSNTKNKVMIPKGVFS